MAGGRGLPRIGCAGWLVGAYLLLATYSWFDFASINRDGLANVGLMLVTAPVTLVGLALSGSGTFALMPSGHGYLANHALYYVPAAAITAFLLWLIGRWIDRRRRGGMGDDR